MTLIDKDELYGRMMSEMVGTGYQSRALDVISMAPDIEPPPNPPLTLEELRDMCYRCEGIYVVYTDGAPVFREQTYCAAVLDFSPSFDCTKMRVHAIYGDRLTLWEDDYGKTWLACRRKPEEGTT